MQNSLKFWGVKKQFSLKEAVAAMKWEEVPLEKQAKHFVHLILFQYLNMLSEFFLFYFQAWFGDNYPDIAVI